MDKLLSFIHLTEQLKTEQRNGHTSKGSRESIADHCWRASLMVLLLGPFLEQKIDVEKALKLAIIHDLAEVVTGDSSYFLFMGNKKAQQEKYKRELQAIKSLIRDLPPIIGNEILALWNEFENVSTREAKFVLAIDKMEAQIQHNEADSSKWTSDDIKYAPTLLDAYCEFDSFLKSFKLKVQEESLKKIEEINNQTVKDK